MDYAASEMAFDRKINTLEGQPPQKRGHAYSSPFPELSHNHHMKEGTGRVARKKHHLCLATALGFDCYISLYYNPHTYFCVNTEELQ